MARKWQISIPVRPKAVQSVRGGRGGFFPDRKVKLWKAGIAPYIKLASPGKPTALPLRITCLRYMFAYPKSTSKRMREFIDHGGLVPYIGCADITDNLSKGLIDTCAGIVFENDKQIWWMCDVQKVYSKTNGIYLEFEETPDVVLIDGKLGSGDKLPVDSFV